MNAKLYSLSLSHPGIAAHLMLERKRIPHRVVDLRPGFHPLVVRLAGFRGLTVPALEIDGQRLQHSVSISRALEELRPEPRLFPDDPVRRRAVEEAEEWGERELQPLPRRLFRWGVANRHGLRRWMSGEIARMPAPGLAAYLTIPVGRWFANVSGADDARVRADIEELPALLDRVDAMIAVGTIGGEEPNAADFQIGTAVRVLAAQEDMRDRVERRPAAELAFRILPRYPTVPRFLPPDWL